MAGALIAGRYELHGELATGGTASVSLGRQIGVGGFARTVAIKRLHARYSRDPEFLGMFLDEARLVARVRHPNVVQTLDVVAERGELFLVMDYVHGQSLSHLLKGAREAQSPVPIDVVASVMAGVLHGLHAAHEARCEDGRPLGLVHRDVSPQNILVGVDGVARIVDFGVAKATERVQTTRDGQLKGKLAYMAPEQLRGERVDRRTDVYAAAVVLWEALTGARLFTAENEGAVVSRVLTGTIEPPSSIAQGLPGSLDAIVMKGLAREPHDRFASALEMASALEACMIPARISDVGAWVAATARDSIQRRSAVLARVESSSSVRMSSSARETFDSLRSQPAPRAAHPSQPTLTSYSSRPPLAVSVAPPGAPARTGSRWGATLAIGATLTLAAVLGATALAARQRRETAASARALTRSARVDPSVGMAAAAPAPTCPSGMVLVPGGKFFMGSDDDLPNERPAHNVTLDAYCMDELEVTTAQYKACSDEGSCKRAGMTNKWTGLGDRERRAFDALCNVRDPEKFGSHPINCVDWEMADRFCRVQGKRLPTEAEWEFAARGPDGRRYPWGDEAPNGKLVNGCGAECTAWGKKSGVDLAAMYADDDGWTTTAPVGSFPAGKSRYGVQDVVGNVWEWTSDRYGAYAGADQENPTGPASGDEHVIRGGGWNTSLATCARPSYRWHDAPDTRSYAVGFRCARSLTR